MDKFLPIREVQRIAGEKSGRTIYRWVSEGRFPPPVQIGPNSVAWSADAIHDWVEAKKKDDKE